MRWRRLRSSDVLVFGEERRLLLGRDVQHVHTLAGLAREADQALCAQKRHLRVTPDRMRARIVLDT